MVSAAGAGPGRPSTAARAHGRAPPPAGHRVPGQRRHAAGELLPGGPRVCVGRADRGLPHAHTAPQVGVRPRRPPTPAPCRPHPTLLAPHRQRRDSGGGGSSVFEVQESWERLSDGGKSGPEEPGDSPPLRHRPQGPAPPSLFGDQPDLTCLIDTNFSARTPLSEPPRPEPRHRVGCGRARDNPGYDFSRLVQRVYQQEGLAPVHAPVLRPPSPGPTLPLAPEDEGGCPPEKSAPALAWAPSADGSIWSLELQGSLIVVGRSSGRLEVGRGAGGRRGWGPPPPAGAHGPLACRCGTPSRAHCAAAVRTSPRGSRTSCS